MPYRNMDVWGMFYAPAGSTSYMFIVSAMTAALGMAAYLPRNHSNIHALIGAQVCSILYQQILWVGL